jgi:hypothetical protein
VPVSLGLYPCESVPFAAEPDACFPAVESPGAGDPVAVRLPVLGYVQPFFDGMAAFRPVAPFVLLLQAYSRMAGTEGQYVLVEVPDTVNSGRANQRLTVSWK